MSKHIDTVKFLMFGWGALQMIGGGLAALLLILSGGLIGGIGGSEGDGALMAMGGFYAVMGMGVGVMIAGMGGLSVAAGFGIGNRKNWGRFMAMALSALALMNFPLGTFLGGFVLYVLLDSETAAEFS